MANIKPFKGYFYNSEKVGDIATVVAPTRYNSTPEEQDALYNMNEYNAIRLFDGRTMTLDNERENKYTRARDNLKNWIENDILVRDKEEAIYLYEETVELNGTKYQNLTYVTLLELEELGNDVHMCEEIREISRQDRYDLLEATNSDLSMISCLYIDRNKQLYRLMTDLSHSEPEIEFDSKDFDMHQRIWRITDKEIIKGICHYMKRLKLYITDGQTRYNAALKYREIMKEKNPNHTGTEPYNYTMVSLIDSNSDGIAIMPEHRKIKVPSGYSEELLVALAQDHFKVEKIIVDSQDEPITETMKKQIQTKSLNTCLAIYSGGNYFYRLTLTDTDYIKDNLLPEMSKYYCGVDTVVLRKLIINDIFGIEEDYKDLVSTSISTRECVRAIENGEADVMVVLNRVKAEEIEKVTEAKELFPFRTLSIFPRPSVGAIINVKED